MCYPFALMSSVNPILDPMHLEKLPKLSPILENEPLGNDAVKIINRSGYMCMLYVYKDRIFLQDVGIDEEGCDGDNKTSPVSHEDAVNHFISEVNFIA